MKRGWIFFSVMAVMAAFSLSAGAADLHLQGSYIVTGLYEDNREIREGAPSMAFYAQRLRLEPQLKVADGLTLYTRLDAMERVWGQTPIGGESLGSDWLNRRNLPGEQNIQFRRAWVEFLTKIGMFEVGYMSDNAWGTDFGDIDTEGPMIWYVAKFGPVALLATYEKIVEGRLGYTEMYYPIVDVSTGQQAASRAVAVPPGYTDCDFDAYTLTAIYFGEKGKAGLLFADYRGADTRPEPDSIYADYPEVALPNLLEWQTYLAFFKAAFGPLYVEGEVQYDRGDVEWEESVKALGLGNMDYEAWQWYLMARYAAGPVHVGLQYAHASGDDPDTPDELEGIMAPGNVWQPTLVLFNDWIHRFAGDTGTYGKTGNYFANADLYQVFAGFQPTPRFSVTASFAFADADEKPAGFVGDEYGKEFDLTVRYKLFDNLEYLVGFGYLWAGDYYKGTDRNNRIDDDYLVIHQLTLSF